jgi:Predicted ornithine cyclodeaminase, mu-crystallin homolog
MLILKEPDVQRLLLMRECIRLMREAFQALGSGEAINQPRRRLILDTGSILHQMAASCRGYFGTKIYSTNPRGGAYFAVLLYEAATARPLAFIEADHLGQIRTGAASGLATDLLAAPDADTLGIIGSGFQARSQVEAVCAVRPIRQVRVWSRSANKRNSFAEQMSEKLKIPVNPVESAEAAVRDAPVVVTSTYAKEPVLESRWIAPGTHINAIGSNNPARRELPPDLLCRAREIVVDSVEQARIEAGDLVLALNDNDWREKVVPLEKVLASSEPPVRGPEDITVFKSVGLAVQDVAAAAYVYERARAEGLGVDVPILNA